MNIRCPRCGYDQRGVLSTWAESCPMRGVCPECGLEFGWGHVIHPEKFEPRWCVEFARTITGYARSVLHTAGKSLLPWKFWRDLKMSDPFCWMRLMTYVLILLMLLPLTYAIEQSGVAVRVYAFVSQDLQETHTSIQREVAAIQARLAGRNVDELSGADVSDHQWMTIMRPRLAVPPTVNFALHEATIEAILHPRRSVSAGTVTGVYGTRPYPEPQVLHLAAYSIPQNWTGPPPLRILRQQTWMWFAAGLVATFGIPLGFVFLPVSLSRAKVRWSHVSRITLYSMLVPVISLFLFGVTMGAHFSIVPLRGPLFPVVIWLARWPMLIGLNIWWICAINRYLKIPHSWAVAPSLTVLSVLLVGSVTYLIAPGILIGA